MSKVVFLIEQPLDQRNHVRFGIDAWLERGWTVEVWDLTPLTSPRVWKTSAPSYDKRNFFEGHFVLTSKTQLEQRIAAHETIDCFVDFSGDSYRAARIKQRLARTGASRIIADLGSIPDFPNEVASGFLARVMAITGGGWFSWIEKASKKLNAAFTGRFAKPNFVLVSGKRSLESALSAGFEHEIVRAHNFDYDRYLNLRAARDRHVSASRGFAVFLDQDVAFHPEFAYENLTPYVTPAEYFPTICAGLRRIASKLDLDAQVAAHPRASYQHRDLDYFESIPVALNKTAELISACKVVVGHTSTALQFAVLFKKPIIFVTTNELAVSSLGPYVEKFAALLGKALINLNDDLEGIDWQTELRVDEAKYDAYRNTYIKVEGSPDTPLWEIVITSVEKKINRDSSITRPVGSAALSDVF